MDAPARRTKMPALADLLNPAPGKTERLLTPPDEAARSAARRRANTSGFTAVNAGQEAVSEGQEAAYDGGDEEPAEEAPVRVWNRVRCLRCLRSIHPKHLADHMKTHKLQGSLGAPVSDPSRCCRRCRDIGRRCVVALDVAQVRTLRCLCCLTYKEACSFLSTYRNQRAGAIRHPALD
ncbi:hypothetical protein CDD83_10764 [Cordyceps sp. RAO-2017]|nr:hypothetical protein CDD83_10764 [Cordyceps sp. RAO-2017]